MDRTLIERLDSFPFRHRVEELMSRPPFQLPADTPLGAVASGLVGQRRSAVVTLDADGRASGIFTEQDLVRRVAQEGAAALQRTLGEAASRPVQGVAAGAFLYVALGRMDRLGIRHLVVEDAAGRALGLLSARAVLRTRAAAALRLGDGIAAAADGAAMKAVHDELPQVAAALLAEGVAAGDVAAVISGVNRGLAARAAGLAALRTAAELGPAPASWSYLVLGSAGREESLLAPDQDNALVHAGDEAAGDAWFARMGALASDLQDAAGIPYCKGGVMASKPAWRHSLAAWERLVTSWTRAPEAEKLLSIDIFYDFVAVAGDAGLAQRLGVVAKAAAAGRALPKLMAQQLSLAGPPLSFLGGFKTLQGRLDLKRHGLYPVVAAARILALALGLEARGTLARLAAAAAAGRLNETDHANLAAAFSLCQRLVLEQQVTDLAAGRPASTKVEVGRLGRPRQQELKQALRHIALIAETVKGAVLHA